jgi:hypothetical protein
MQDIPKLRSENEREKQKKTPFFIQFNEARCWIVNDGATGAKTHHDDENEELSMAVEKMKISSACALKLLLLLLNYGMNVKGK